MCVYLNNKNKKVNLERPAGRLRMFETKRRENNKKIHSVTLDVHVENGME